MALTVTELKQDKNLRKTAVPFRGSIWGFNYFDGADRSLIRQVPNLTLSGGSDVDSLSGQGGTSLPTTLNPIRILLPHYGEISSCYLDISMSFATADNGIQCQLAIGNFTLGVPNWTVNTSYSSTYINQSWTQINGTSTPMTVTSGAINPNTFNLLPALYPSSSPYYVPEAFVLLIYFSKTPTANSFVLNYLNVHAAVQGIT